MCITPQHPEGAEMPQITRMIRTGMHLTPTQVDALNAFSIATGAPVAELVRRAVEAAYVRPRAEDHDGEVGKHTERPSESRAMSRS